ncbi:MAG: GNAT family N-acetyltransferase [Candidatus Hodarchaeales archaeon]|jgi:RimJ/RimL family protein N-acetyltransferase
MLLEIPSSIETTRLIIRKYKKGDGESLLKLIERNDNREYLKSHVTEASTIMTHEEAEIRIRNFIASWVARKRFVLGIWLRTSNLYIGQIWIEPKKWEVPSFELGWFVDRIYQSQGIATEASKRAIEFLFNDLKAHKIIVLTRDDNVRSYKLAERCGFTKEGHLKDHDVKNGKRIGLFCYRLLKHDYISKNTKI